ncbi:hypothetical protein JTE90_025821 [Oedothorax gibbosus]|uniref:Uncharacterized protein n=1 Tax=Oedothorax gibbosus TaxID=931172 RepID=A0AAV6UVI5_9ARAC|nr:hypothetical protein JTE90_025821 [Oedothorax gibbosus]
MVTEAGKELLRNTINTAKFHNKIIEENEMWKQWELECGLTMMVSDDDILKKFKKKHICSKHRRRDKSQESCKRDSKSSESLTMSSAGPSKADSDRWDHSGFQELYPGGVSSSSSTSKSNSARWDHSGFHELYPEKDRTKKRSSSSSSKSHSSKHKKKRKKHSRHSSDSSDNEIYEEFKRFKRAKAEEQKLKSEPQKNSKGFDSHVKEWKKMKHKS